MKPFTLILTVLLSVITAYAQNVIVITNDNGKTRASIPVQSGGQSPSVILNQRAGGGIFLATGPAAQILARNQALPVDRPTPIANPETDIRPIFDVRGQYVGSVSRLAENLYVTAAHVMMETQDLDAVAASLNMPLTEFKMFQPELLLGRALDVVFITTLAEADLQRSLVTLLQNYEIAGESNHDYTVNYLTFLDHKVVKLESQGVWSAALDQKTIYLKSVSTNLLTWGSSGSLVFGQNGNQQARLIGVVQCAVKVEVASSQEEKNVDYFRAISVISILSSVVKPVDLQTMRQRSADYGLSQCDPVSGKKGGGG